MNDHSYTLITFHFGDIFWVRHLLEQVLRFENSQIEKIIIVDQSRTSLIELEQLSDKCEVITFEPNLEEIKKIGHDHPSALNRATKLESINTTHVLIFDSDCFPTKQNWLSQKLNRENVVLAQDPGKWGLSHPCFMKIPSNILRELDFSEGTLELGIDTGRLIGLQISKLGLKPKLLVPRSGFSGFQGDYYLDDCLFHMGSSSFKFSSDGRLSTQVSLNKQAFLKRKIQQGSFSLSFPERLWLNAITWMNKAQNKTKIFCKE